MEADSLDIADVGAQIPFSKIHVYLLKMFLHI